MNRNREGAFDEQKQVDNSEGAVLHADTATKVAITGPAASVPGNFDGAAGPGCHIARHPDDQGGRESSWVIEWEPIDPSDYDEDEVPDLALEEGILTLCNIHGHHVVAYITVYETQLRGRDGHVLVRGATTDDGGTTQVCTTLIVLCPPQTFVHLCSVDDGRIRNNPDLLNLDSDVQEWRRHPRPEDAHAQSIRFPLQGDGPFLCTQGVGGHLTHFFSGNLHAIDFRCPVGTPLVAACDGVVVDVTVRHGLTGIAVSNLFRWNSILIRMDQGNPPPDDDPLFVEYVHIDSSLVRKGDRVQRGQLIGMSGSVGFSPEPHLHFAAYRSADATAPTVRVCFESYSRNDTHSPEQSFLPRAGCWYNSTGLVEVNPASC
jgi:Peptidase family M23